MSDKFISPRKSERSAPDKPWENLAMSIIRQAITDDNEYRKALKKWQKRVEEEGMRYNSEVVRIEGHMESIKEFFYSQWFECLCDADGRMIYRAVERNFKNGRRPLMERGRRDVRT